MEEVHVKGEWSEIGRKTSSVWNGQNREDSAEQCLTSAAKSEDTCTETWDILDENKILKLLLNDYCQIYIIFGQ